jgi:protoporphyrin/coproporphyrin ferrochelatase
VLAALDRLAGGLRARADLVFTAHSIPRAMAAGIRIRRSTRRRPPPSPRASAGETGLALPHTCVYQSRSGRPEDPWLEPDICDYLRAARARGVDTVVICPAGFICDHIEVLYDLDTEAAAVAREIGLRLVRAESVNDHPAFLDTMADVVLQTVSRYQGARPLPLVPA